VTTLVQSASAQSHLNQGVMAQASKTPHMQANFSNEPSMTYSVSNTKMMAEIEEKRHENLVLERRKSEAEVAQSEQSIIFGKLRDSLSQQALTVIVFGASGHLAKTKTYPALYDLFCEGIFPENVHIVGYARSKLKKSDFDKKISIKLKGFNVPNFLERCTYVSGKGYDDDASYQILADTIAKLEDSKYEGRSNRVCYLATPPTVFVPVCERIKKFIKVEDGTSWTRVIIEKPFGKDLPSSNKLHHQIGQFLKEEEVYRIDHYLAKEMVQNIIVFRFSNMIWDAIWNRKYIRCVKISMKESAALEGRGGYYDEYGVIRDVLQNHLFQVLTLIAMEQPCSLRAEDVRDEKVKVLKCIKPMVEERTVVGQYGPTANGKKPGYRDDPSIKNSDNPQSNQITFIQTVLFVESHRWAHVPFICKCGKGLDERNTEVRIQFKNDGLCLFPDANFNEIVMRLQPNEAIWCKVNTKTPGFARFDKAQAFELDLTYKNRFGPLNLPAAYTRLILDALEGDQSLFVRGDELREAWRIVTPFIHKLADEDKDPQKYARGGRGPPQADEMAKEYGFRQSTSAFDWKSPKISPNL